MNGEYRNQENTKLLLVYKESIECKTTGGLISGCYEVAIKEPCGRCIMLDPYKSRITYFYNDKNKIINSRAGEHKNDMRKYINIKVDGKNIQVAIYRMLAMIADKVYNYIGDPDALRLYEEWIELAKKDEYIVFNHMNGDQFDNRYKNLEAVTLRQNNLHAALMMNLYYRHKDKYITTYKIQNKTAFKFVDKDINISSKSIEKLIDTCINELVNIGYDIGKVKRSYKSYKEVEEQPWDFELIDYMWYKINNQHIKESDLINEWNKRWIKHE